jgi:ribosomal protein S18 acetylase RimI-like enzyme
MRDPIKIFRGAGWLVSTDKDRLDRVAIYGFLSTSYWRAHASFATVSRSIDTSICFGLYHGPDERFAGFCRLITDEATFAYLCDVFVLPDYRGQGLSKHLMASAMAHPALQEVTRIALHTRNAHGLYEGFGFEVTKVPERIMEISRLPPNS